jgi:hypothetical protein
MNCEMSNTNDPVKELFKAITPEMVEAGQEMSMLSVFVQTETISLSQEEIANILFTRFSEHVEDLELTLEEIMSYTKKTVKRGITKGYLEQSIIPNKYMPTNFGWDLGRTYYDMVFLRKVQA